MPRPTAEHEHLEQPCPACGEQKLRIEIRLEATKGLVGGSQLKVAAQDWPWLVCDGCGVEARGKR